MRNIHVVSFACSSEELRINGTLDTSSDIK